MTTAELCILIACLLPIVCAWIAKQKGFGKPRREGGFDNHNPRQWLANLQGLPARAHAAQMNSFEALPLFIAGVLVAERMQAAQGRDRWPSDGLHRRARRLHRRLSGRSREPAFAAVGCSDWAAASRCSSSASTPIPLGAA